MTSRLLGVDFVPSFRSGSGTGVGGVRPVDAPSVEVKPQSEPGHAAPDESGSALSSVDADPSDPAARLEALRERYTADAPHDAFVTDHTNIVFGEGDPRARLMFVGEAPGQEEDRTGRPFVGKAGQLLDKMIVAMGLSRESVYICNVLKTRPPNNQTPTVEEARACAPYLYEQIRIVSPEAIVTLGKSASQLLLGTTESMGRMRGHWAEFPPNDPLVNLEEIGLAGFGPIPVMPTYHPAFLLRSYTADNRSRVWSDLQQVMARLGLAAQG